MAYMQCKPVHETTTYCGTEHAKINNHGLAGYHSEYKHQEIVTANPAKHHSEHGLIGKITGLFHKKKKNREGHCHDGGSSSSSDSDSDHEGCEPRKKY